MARPINLLPSCLLVFIGAWAGVGHALRPLLLPAVWLMALLSGGVAVASCVVNDYFDLRSDTINAPHKPLPSGIVPPDGALLLASSVYIAVLVAACLMEPPLLRAIIAFSAAATLLYTPLLKRITGIKTATVAAIIALSPVSGALAAGAGWAGVCATAAPAAFAFLAMAHRETLMDLNDVAGDRAAGVWTLPVVAGPRAALATTAVLLAGAAAVAIGAALLGSGLAWAWARNPAAEGDAIRVSIDR
ncbi:hypothetical protein WJX81_001046 [Elliptochloris bilobata]|uniref:Uncharacterized protein n=1 Tax=Elliptochloris bilobata TaxID=381761 RepID=A0AAW1RXH2_9CHLO